MKTSIEFTVNEKALEPEIPFGATAVCLDIKPDAGDYVAYVISGRSPIFRRYLPKSDGTVLLEATNANFQSFTCTNEQFSANGKVYVIISTVKIFRPAEVERINREKEKEFEKQKEKIRREAEARSHEQTAPAASGNITSDNAVSEILTFDEAQAILKLCRSKMYAILQSGELKAIKLGHLWRIERSEINRYISGKAKK